MTRSHIIFSPCFRLFLFIASNYVHTGVDLMPKLRLPYYFIQLAHCHKLSHQMGCIIFFLNKIPVTILASAPLLLLKLIVHIVANVIHTCCSCLSFSVVRSMALVVWMYSPAKFAFTDDSTSKGTDGHSMKKTSIFSRKTFDFVIASLPFLSASNYPSHKQSTK